ncbi:MAG TPA: hypothetical protein DCZ34_00670, partial [Clostridiales bacterium]|nr:hypothetical protein [Clostridiales bacterium]
MLKDSGREISSLFNKNLEYIYLTGSNLTTNVASSFSGYTVQKGMPASVTGTFDDIHDVGIMAFSHRYNYRFDGGGLQYANIYFDCLTLSSTYNKNNAIYFDSSTYNSGYFKIASRGYYTDRTFTLDVFSGSDVTVYAWFSVDTAFRFGNVTGGSYDLNIETTTTLTKTSGYSVSGNKFTYYQSEVLRYIVTAVPNSGYQFVRWVYPDRDLNDATDKFWISAVFVPADVTRTYKFSATSGGSVTITSGTISYGMAQGKYFDDIDSSSNSVKWSYYGSSSIDRTDFSDTYADISANFGDDVVNEKWNSMIESTNGIDSVPSSLVSAAKNNVFTGYNTSGVVGGWTCASVSGFVANVGYFYGTMYFYGDFLRYGVYGNVHFVYKNSGDFHSLTLSTAVASSGNAFSSWSANGTTYTANFTTAINVTVKIADGETEDGVIKNHGNPTAGDTTLAKTFTVAVPYDNLTFNVGTSGNWWTKYLSTKNAAGYNYDVDAFCAGNGKSGYSLTTYSYVEWGYKTSKEEGAKYFRLGTCLSGQSTSGDLRGKVRGEVLVIYHFSSVFISVEVTLDPLIANSGSSSTAGGFTYNSSSNTYSKSYTVTGNTSATLSVTLPTPSLANYTFGGWYTQFGGAGNQITSSTKIPLVSKITFYANWKALVSFNTTTNGGSGIVSGSYYGAQASVSLPSGTSTAQTGWTFEGWNTNLTLKTGLTSYTMQGYKGSPDLKPANVKAYPEPITLYAIYKTTSQVTVSFYNFDGTCAKTSTQYYYNNETAQSPSTIVIEDAAYGVEPYGWWSYGNSDKIYGLGSSVPVYASDTSTGGLSKNNYYPSLTKKITVKYNSNGGTGTMNDS